MRAEWKTLTVGEIAATVRNALVGGPFGSNLVSQDYVDEGVPVIRGQNMGTRWVGGEFAFVSREKAEQLKANLATPGDIVFTQRGTLGQAGVVPQGPYAEYVVSQSQMKLTVNAAIADPMFVYYAFSCEPKQEYIRQNAIQTGVPHTNLGILRDTPIDLPPLQEQRAIAHILGTLDDKIELNRRMSETLEAMARALFKSWFVDFDPVRAKIDGRWKSGQSLPGLPAHLYDLFPDRVIDSELGEIPEGWGVGSILEQAVLLSGGTPKTSRADYWGGGVRWASAKDVSQSGQIFLIQTGRTITEKGLAESNTQMIPSLSTVVVARGATTGRMVLFGDRLAMNQTCYALVSRMETPFFLYNQLRQRIRDLTHAAHGSVFDTITTSTFKNAQFVLPRSLVIKVFEKIVKTHFFSVLTATRENIVLAELRDHLLPRLISGELQTPVPGGNRSGSEKYESAF